MKLTKKEEKWLRKQVEELPKQTYKAFHKYKEPVKEMNEDGTFVLRKGYLEDCEVNHFRRAKNAYESNGMEGLNVYFVKHGFHFIKKENPL